MNFTSGRMITGAAQSESLTQRIDEEIKSLFYAHFGDRLPGCTLIALGGYGRRDLCPYSDLDLLLLVERRTTRKEITAAIEDILYPLWDKGFNASYSVRTVKETLHDAKDDFFFRTSLIDARYICGSDLLATKLTHVLEKKISLRNTRKFVSDLLSHTHKRHAKFGDTSYILEPDLKEGHGGLRDYQTVMWAMKVISQTKNKLPDLITPMDIHELGVAHDFILKIRYLLHEISGRKNDRMYLEFQEVLAKEMVFSGSDVETSVETFMKQFHRQALTIKSITDSFLFSLAHTLNLTKSPADRVIDEHFKLTAGQLTFTNPGEVRRSPYLIMRAFEHLAAGDYTFSPSARFLIRKSFDLAEDLRNSSQAHETFLRILSMKKSAKILTCMLETGLLELFIPEFEKIKGRTIFDLYHTYTVDLHSIQTVAELNELEESESEIFSRVNDRNALYLSAFLHDIGKGYGLKHEIVGADIAASISTRFDLSGDSVDLVRFLIHNHIVMADLATKLDLTEERVAVEFARKMKDPQRLSMLYLLTVADSKATGPLGWNEWKEALLSELYAKALHVMEKGIFKDPANTQLLERKWEQLMLEIARKPGHRHASPLWALPQAYILYSDTPDIIRHMDLRSRIDGPEDIEVDVTPKDKHVTLTIITRDRPGLFSMLTGILAMNHLEIISAKVFTWLDGVAVDVFKVIPPWPDFSEWHKITAQFKKATTGNMDIRARLASTKALKNNDQNAPNATQKASITIDNETSDFFTLVEIRAQNSLGMLYHVSRTITGFGLDIHRAFVSRNGDLGSNVFYVVDALGEKIEDEQRRLKLSADIQRVIDNPWKREENPLHDGGTGNTGTMNRKIEQNRDK
ncbi:MAG TPA: [protein-PII] uridylyltransferase [Deltaproteobacteria bacterium]|nr:[protein-PII] uridylyltransferase [Deltaproteobacteria bacterium]